MRYMSPAIPASGRQENGTSTNIESTLGPLRSTCSNSTLSSTPYCCAVYFLIVESISFRRCACVSCILRISKRVATVNSAPPSRSEEHTSELQSLMRISYAVFCLKKKNKPQMQNKYTTVTKHRNTLS